jgi:hypothetical protein
MKKWSLPTEKVGKRSDKSEIIPNFTAERKFQHGSSPMKIPKTIGESARIHGDSTKDKA